MKEIPRPVKIMLDKYSSEFKEIFDTTLGQFVGRLWILGIPDFNIIKFEKFLWTRGYAIVSNKQCIADFVEEKYGIRGRELIDKLISEQKGAEKMVLQLEDKDLKIKKSIHEIAEEVEQDPEVAEQAEKDQRELGTLTPEDLRKQFTI